MEYQGFPTEYQGCPWEYQGCPIECNLKSHWGVPKIVQELDLEIELIGIWLILVTH